MHGYDWGACIGIYPLFDPLSHLTAAIFRHGHALMNAENVYTISDQAFAAGFY